MSTTEIQSFHGLIVEEDIPLTLDDLCQACCASREHVVAWVVGGCSSLSVKHHRTGVSPVRPCIAHGWPCGSPAIWKSICPALPGVALALDLFDEIAALQAHQQRLGPR